jgi:hypothetical protein
MRHFILAVLISLVCPWLALAQTTQPAVVLSTGIEDGKKMIHATVTLNGKAVENLTLQYFVQRTFGNLLLGQDTTLDDGTSALAFPSDLPGAPDGQLHLIVRISTPANYSSISASASFPADIQPARDSEEFPRALWASHAPLSLMVGILVILGAVWSTYLFVVSRIFAIRMGGKI